MARKEFLTPPDLPSELTCRTLRMPASGEWLGIFNSALLDLTEAWRYEQVNATDLTIEETIARVQEVLSSFFASSECESCLQPTGQPFIRIAPSGAFEQFIDGGWYPPEGDYTIPPVTPREGGSDIDKRCLAAANAARVLEILYEDVSDSYAAAATESEAIISLLLAIAAIIAGAISLAAAAIIAIAGLIFRIIYDGVAVVGADYWTSDFNEKVQCALFACSEVDLSGVVTFDFACFNNELAQQIDVLSSPYDVALFGQIQYFMMIIGGDGLNLAGATTSITDADCTDCPDDWCFRFEVGVDFDTWVQEGIGVLTAAGWETQPVSTAYSLFVSRTFASAYISSVAMFIDSTAGGAPNVAALYIQPDLQLVAAPTMVLGEWNYFFTINAPLTKIWMNPNGSGNTNTAIVKWCEVRGKGFCPFGEPNCE